MLSARKETNEDGCKEEHEQRDDKEDLSECRERFVENVAQTLAKRLMRSVVIVMVSVRVAQKWCVLCSGRVSGNLKIVQRRAQQASLTSAGLRHGC